MNGNDVSSRIDVVEGASNGINDVMAQAIGQVADGASSSPEDGADVGPCPAFLKFLECEVAVDQLMEFLELEEMKVLCLVSKDMLKAVMRTREFPKRTLFNIKKEFDASEADDLHNRFSFSWKHIAFDVSLPVRVVNQFADKLKCVESLQLYHKDREMSTSEVLSPSGVTEFCIRIHVILSLAVNLRELQLDPAFLGYPLNETFSTWEVQQSMSKLESLIVEDLGWSPFHSDQFQQNLLQLSRCPFSKIKKISMLYCKIDKSEELDCIVEIVKVFKETLEVLELHSLFIWRLEKITAVRCPNLRQLTLAISETDLEAVAAFVETQPLLGELDLSIYQQKPTKDLKCFQGRLPNLRKLRYYFDQVQDQSTEMEEVDWTFLEAMTKLEEINVKLPFDGRGPEMIDRLPESVKKLELECNQRDHDFWSRCLHLEDFSPNIGNRLKRLKNLTHLSFDECSDAVSDVGLQAIIKNFPNLMQLRLRKCTKLTDFGISGVSGNDAVNECEAGVPLSDLKGLVELEISYCDLVTTACILTVVRFKYLRRFTFDTSAENEVQDTEQFASQIREQNPRLVTLFHNRHAWERNGLVWTQ